MIDSDIFRAGMRRHAAAVAIVTTDGEAGRAGFTASSVCGVTDDPPTLLVCLNRNAGLEDAFRTNSVMAVNTLARAHADLADVFAGSKGSDMAVRFAHGDWNAARTGAPVLEGALVTFDCRIDAFSVIGTHVIIFGRIVDLALGAQDAEALLWLNRGYRSVGFDLEG